MTFRQWLDWLAGRPRRWQLAAPNLSTAPGAVIEVAAIRLGAAGSLPGVISYAGVTQMVLHRCPVSGQALCQSVPLGVEPRCEPPDTSCGAPILPDRAARAGHAWVFCPYCCTSIGLCGAESLDGLAGEAAAILEV